MKTTKNRLFVSVIVPAYNEEKNIEKIIKLLKKESNYDLQIIVAIDSKTTDKTYQLASKFKNVEVFQTKNTKGKGDVIRQAISKVKGDYAVQIDADSQFLPADIPKLIEPLTKGYDVTLGTRYQNGSKIEKGSVSTIKKIGSYFLSFMTSLVTGVRVTDVMAGFKAFKAPVLKSLRPKVSHFGYEAELVIRASQKNFKIINIPINYKKRVIGQSTVNSLKHGLLVLITILVVGLDS